MKYLIITIIIVSLVSCEKTIDLKLPNSQTSTLVVEGGIEHPEDGLPATQQIRLTTTQHFFDQDLPTGVDDATMSITDGVTEIDFTSIGNGWYEIQNFNSQEGETYTLTINYQGQVYEASETLPNVVPIDRIYSEFESGSSIFGTDDGYAVKLDYTDPEDGSNFYFWRLIVNGDYIFEADESNRNTLIRNDDFFNGQDVVGLKAHEEFLAQPGDTAILEQYSITSELYDYYFSIFSLTGGSGLLGDPPPSSVNGNIRNLTDPANRALGYFYVCSVSEREHVVQE